MSLDVEALVARLAQEGEEGVRRELTTPVLLRTFEEVEEEAPLVVTQTLGAPLEAPAPSGPVAYPVRKGSSKLNAFAMGITLGRVEGNDVVVHHPSVSRFHAYLLEAREGWLLFDAESRNGTWLNERKLVANVPGARAAGERVEDQARLRLGQVQLRFLGPDAFLAYLQQRRAAR